MKHSRAEMFNRKAASPKSKPDKILQTLALRQGQNIADIGSGGGYFALRFAESVGIEGLVFAVDTNPEFLEIIRSRAKEKGLHNVRTILITEDKISLPENSLDFIFMRNVFHHLPNRVEYLKKLRSALKPEGKAAVVEHKRRGFFSFHRLFGHYVPKEVIVEDMKKAGYQVKEVFDFLPEQSFTIFSL
jgi:ubiquinone/menaquinone biosynthesis C-methylase UbiE